MPGKEPSLKVFDLKTNTLFPQVHFIGPRVVFGRTGRVGGIPNLRIKPIRISGVVRAILEYEI